MITNRLTKALSQNEFHEFLDQVNLIDIVNQIVNQEAHEDKNEELDHNTLQMYMREIN